MKIIVDTCVWSMALRRNESQKTSYVKELKELIREVRAQLIGPVRQELLSGIKSTQQFTLLKNHFETFDDLTLIKQDYELAAEYFNIARSKGIQGSTTDFLICAISTRHNMSIFTTDKDFIHYQTVLPVSIHSPR